MTSFRMKILKLFVFLREICKKGEAYGGNKRKRGFKGKKEEEKIQYAEFVSMTNAEHEKLVSTYGNKFVNACITTLDNYKRSKWKKIQK